MGQLPSNQKHTINTPPKHTIRNPHAQLIRQNPVHTKLPINLLNAPMSSGLAGFIRLAGNSHNSHYLPNAGPVLMVECRAVFIIITISEPGFPTAHRMNSNVYTVCE